MENALSAGYDHKAPLRDRKGDRRGLLSSQNLTLDAASIHPIVFDSIRMGKEVQQGEAHYLQRKANLLSLLLVEIKTTWS